jgi:hypothetical protein
MKASKEIILSKKKMYQKATRKGKSLILSGLQEAIGLSRKHLSRVLNGSYEYENCQYKKSARGRKAKYNQEHTKILVVLWQLLDYPCASRLKGSLKDTLDNLISCGHITISKSLYRDLMSISSATINRLLKPERRTLDPFGIATTKPGSMLKKQIPIRRGTDWDDAIPGFVEIDLVAHCGSSTKGDYVNTLDCTDVKSGWTECYAVINKARTHTLNAMKAIQQRLPFPLKGVDSDNGSEFINQHFLYFAKEEDLVFTRSRPNRSNDSCYVEQKNWSVVRQAVGYARFEGQETVDLLNLFYEQLRLYNNFFKASQKLLKRERDGSKVSKKHDAATTPYRRLLLDPELDDFDKQKLKDTFATLDVWQLRANMDSLLSKIHEFSIRY